MPLRRRRNSTRRGERKKIQATILNKTPNLSLREKRSPMKVKAAILAPKIVLKGKRESRSAR